MNLYCFILGRNPSLAVAEIIKVIGQDILEIVGVSERTAVLKMNKEIADPGGLISRLYGTTKIVKLIDTINDRNLKAGLTEIFSDQSRCQKYFPAEGKKTIFGISLYNLDTSTANFRSLLKQMTALANLVKTAAKNSGYKCGFVKTDGNEITSGSIRKNQLLENGADIVLITGSNQTFVGKTIAIQDFDDYEKRNYQRPIRDLKSGVMPVKLARIMITLSGAKPEETVIDPFCGSGTIIQELALMEFKKISGLDNSTKAVDDCKKNLLWLFEQYPQLDKKLLPDIQLQDARELSKVFKKDSVGTIITEPYLGPIQEKQPTSKEVEKIISELSGLYLEFFRQAAAILKSTGVIAIIFPVFKENNQLVLLDILNQIKKIGFTLESPLPPKLTNFPAVKLTDRNSLLLEKENQIITREILLFKKIS